VEAGLVLEPLLPRLKFSQFLIVLSWWILDHARKEFNKMYIRLQEL
jgi:hypothetical protein